MYDHPSPAGAVAAALAARAEEVCQRYLPHGCRQGRYWVAGDIDGARGRSLFVRLHGPGVPGKWTDAAVGTHGDLLDLIQHRTNAPTLRAALIEARAFLALPASPAPAIRATTTPPKRRGGFGGDAAPSTAPMRKPTSGHGASRAAGSRRCASIRSFATAKAPRSSASPPLSPRSPATTAPSRVCTAHGSIRTIRPRLRSPRPGRRSAASTASPCVSVMPPDDPLLRSSSARASRPCCRLVTAVPEITAAAALSAGSLGSFSAPARLLRPRHSPR